MLNPFELSHPLACQPQGLQTDVSLSGTDVTSTDIGPKAFNTCHPMPNSTLRLKRQIGLHILKSARMIQMRPSSYTLPTAKRVLWADKTTEITENDSMHAAIQLFAQVGLKIPLIQAVYTFPTVPRACGSQNIFMIFRTQCPGAET